MFKSIVLAAMLLAGGALVSTSSVDAGHPYRGQRHGGYRSFRPAIVTPNVVHRYGHSYGRHHGYSGQRYPAYRPSIGIGIGGYPGYGYSGFGNPGFGGYGGYGGFGGYRGFGGSGISLYFGR